MLIILSLTILTALVIGALYARERVAFDAVFRVSEEGLTNSINTIARLEDEAQLRNVYLDYLFRTFNLATAQPYVQHPSYEEKRCLHCFYPEFAGHEKSCPWLHCQPLTSVLYAPPPVPTGAPSATDAENVGPVPPLNTDEPEDDRLGRMDFDSSREE